MKKIRCFITVLFIFSLCGCNNSDYEEKIEASYVYECDDDISESNERNDKVQITDVSLSKDNIETGVSSTEKPTPNDDVYKYDTKVEMVELKEYYPEYEIHDYAADHGLQFPLEEQTKVYNEAFSFAFNDPFTELPERIGSFTVRGLKMYGALTGYSFKSYDAYRRTIFTINGFCDTRAENYLKNGELFWNMGEKGILDYIEKYRIVYSDDETVIIRLDAIDTSFQTYGGVYFTILLFTEDGWKVDLLRHPRL